MNTQPPDVSGKKILIVDDSLVILRALQLKLQANGYRVFTAPDGTEAVSLILKEFPDLILLDIGFPPDVANGGGAAWDGFRVMEWVRRVAKKYFPVIIITGSNPLEYEDRARAIGAAAIFHKPIDNDELLKTIKEVLKTDRPDAPATE